MASIGGFNFTKLSGVIETFGTELRPFDRPGVDGTGFQDIGRRAPQSTLESLSDYVSFASAYNARVNFRNLKGTIQTVVTDRGDVHYNVLILDVVTQVARAVGPSSGGQNFAPAAILRSTWTVQQL